MKFSKCFMCSARLRPGVSWMTLRAACSRLVRPRRCSVRAASQGAGHVHLQLWRGARECKSGHQAGDLLSAEGGAAEHREGEHSASGACQRRLLRPAGSDPARPPSGPLGEGGGPCTFCLRSAAGCCASAGGRPSPRPSACSAGSAAGGGGQRVSAARTCVSTGCGLRWHCWCCCSLLGAVVAPCTLL